MLCAVCTMMATSSMLILGTAGNGASTNRERAIFTCLWFLIRQAFEQKRASFRLVLKSFPHISHCFSNMAASI